MTRTDYDPLRHPVSSLAFAIGLWHTLRPALWRPLLVGLIGINLIGAEIFITYPINGYPAGTPLILTEYTDYGRIHDLLGVLTFLGLPITRLVFCFAFGRARDYKWAAYSVFSSVATFTFFILTVMGLRQTPKFSAFAGLFQRLSIIGGLGWLTLLAKGKER